MTTATPPLQCRPTNPARVTRVGTRGVGDGRGRVQHNKNLQQQHCSHSACLPAAMSPHSDQEGTFWQEILANAENSQTMEISL